MSHIDKISSQEILVSKLLENMEQILGQKTGGSIAATILNTINQLSENGESDEVIIKKIARLTGLSENDPKIGQIITEINDRPMEETYKPFNNPLFQQLLKELED